MRKRELVALLCLSSWFLVIVVWLFLVAPRVCLLFVIVVFPDYTNFIVSSCKQANCDRVTTYLYKIGVTCHVKCQFFMKEN